MMEPSPLEQAVDAVLRAIPAGVVMTYGEVAEEAGFPGRARAVGHLLARSGGDYPWWRVVAANGRLVPGHEREQARRLRAEGVRVGERGVTAMRRGRASAGRGERPARKSPR
jgi:methylated-DNA-protein-cysteine methyltransferase-like protein